MQRNNVSGGAGIVQTSPPSSQKGRSMSNESNGPKTHHDESSRSVARTAADVAIGGTAFAADKTIEVVGDAVERANDAFARARREVEEAKRRAESTAQDVQRTVRQAVGEATDERVYEDRTRDELYDLAAERDISGRSKMRKAELIDALRAQH
jgi:hypothetical protein